MEKRAETAVFGGGCFWCTEAVFQRLKGVFSVTPGYAGGSLPHPTYEEVSQGNSGHVEVVKVDYDPKRITYYELLSVFFATHDPTSVNQQGADVGEQYRSVIFYASEEQKNEAEKYIRELVQDSVFTKPIATKIEPLHNFYQAEDYHKNYYNNSPEKAYCQVVISPKVLKLKEKFAHLIETTPTDALPEIL